MKKLIFVMFISLSVALWAQEDDFFSDDMSFDDMDFDEMFSDDSDDSFIEVVEDKSDEVSTQADSLLTTTGVEWGGSFSSSLESGVTYGQYPSFDGLFNSDNFEESFTPNLSASLHFNARPTEDTRFFGKFTTSVPFYQTANLPLEDTWNTTTGYTFGSATVPDITIYELFSDFNYDNKVFFRIGKQNAKWGVGYFFSPADFLSLEAIDPNNPEADREGPIALKISVPFGLNSFYTYVKVPNSIFTADEPSVTDLIVAPMVQVLIGDVELSSGLFYQKDSAPRGMVTATYGTNGNLGQFSYFGEAVALYGSDKTFINSDYTTTTYDDKLFFNGTAGFRWSKTVLDNNFSLVGQYYFNGEGYSKDDAQRAIDVMDVYTTMATDGFAGLSLAQQAIFTTISSTDLDFSDLMSRNQHYLGAMFGVSNLFSNEDLSFSSYALMNLVDISGALNLSLSYRFFDSLSGTFSASFDLSDEGDEYNTDDFSISLGFNLGGGSF